MRRDGCQVMVDFTGFRQAKDSRVNIIVLDSNLTTIPCRLFDLEAVR